ncbi:MAG TPA: tripartite tricarboxylate transporter substrate binding protein [Xanthobacteraceae bacterium]|jgi:tripartite-type tricarboxylate transporter receptor subunit TctC|nr:tripartite tricarboxylate transporter substrate binding protein [Xanthobacteraceae bacterium]
MKRLHRVAALLSIALAATTTAGRADDYPSRPVRVIVGFTPGASADITARIVANRMGQILNQQFVVENKPGAGSNLAADFVAHAPKDGYTLLIGTSANLTNAVITPNLGFDFVKDFAPIALATTAPIILAVHPSLGVNSVQELIALAKQKPGEIFYASTGVGAAPHLSGELFNARAGIKTVHVPYQGSPQAVTDLIAGRTSMMFSPASAVMPHIESGALKGLASAASKRPSIAPNLPTMAEAGLPDFDTSIWFGLMAPLGTPPEVIDKLARAVNDALASNEVLSSLKTQGFDTLGGSPEEFARTITRDVARWTIAAQAAGMRK